MTSYAVIFVIHNEDTISMSFNYFTSLKQSIQPFKFYFHFTNFVLENERKSYRLKQFLSGKKTKTWGISDNYAIVKL